MKRDPRVHLREQHAGAYQTARFSGLIVPGPLIPEKSAHEAVEKMLLGIKKRDRGSQRFAGRTRSSLKTPILIGHHILKAKSACFNKFSEGAVMIPMVYGVASLLASPVCISLERPRRDAVVVVKLKKFIGDPSENLLIHVFSPCGESEGEGERTLPCASLPRERCDPVFHHRPMGVM